MSNDYLGQPAENAGRLFEGSLTRRARRDAEAAAAAAADISSPAQPEQASWLDEVAPAQPVQASWLDELPSAHPVPASWLDEPAAAPLPAQQAAEPQASLPQTSVPTAAWVTEPTGPADPEPSEPLQAPEVAGPIPVRQLLETAYGARASDVHLTEGLPPQMRVDGSLALIPGGADCTSSDWFMGALRDIMSERQLESLESADEIDFSVAVEGIARFRVNVFRQLGKFAAAMRFIPDETKPLEQLGVPLIAADLATRPRGLVLVTGPTGSGKSTTLAAMIDLVNRKLPTHIVTMEDPVEFRHTSKTALIHQREIGSDTASFAEAMRRVLRQDPDIILIGELRDPESIASALTAAETGHLVLSTLHTQSAAKSINRIVDAFPPAQQAQVRTQLGDALQGIITQTLLPKASGHGRVIATEVLVNTPAIANLIREGEVSQIYSMMQAGGELGMHTLDQDLKRLLQQGEISLELAQSRADDPKSIVEGVRVRSGLAEDTWMGEMGLQNTQGGWTN